MFEKFLDKVSDVIKPKTPEETQEREMEKERRKRIKHLKLDLLAVESQLRDRNSSFYPDDPMFSSPQYVHERVSLSDRIEELKEVIKKLETGEAVEENKTN